MNTGRSNHPIRNLPLGSWGQRVARAQHGFWCIGLLPTSTRTMQKTLITLLTLTVGLAADSALAQRQGDAARDQLRRSPPRAEARADRETRREPAARLWRERAERWRRPDLAAPRPRWQGPRTWDAPAPRFAPDRPGPGWQRGAPMWRGPRFCPHCQRPLRPDFPPGAMRRGWSELPPRGPAWGPPPWAERRGPDADLQPPGRWPRPQPPGLRQWRDRPERPGPEGRFERPRPRPEGRPPADRRPRERDD